VYQAWHNGTPEDGRLGPKHVVLIAKINLNEGINSCIIDRKFYKNKLNIVMQQDAKIQDWMTTQVKHLVHSII
jgi:hypothetical protein